MNKNNWLHMSYIVLGANHGGHMNEFHEPKSSENFYLFNIFISLYRLLI